MQINNLQIQMRFIDAYLTHIDAYLFYSFRYLAIMFSSGVSCTLKLSRAFPKRRINFPAINATRDSIGDVINA